MSGWQISVEALNLSESEKAAGLKEHLLGEVDYKAFKLCHFETKEEVRAAVQELLGKLMEVDGAVEWRVTYHDPSNVKDNRVYEILSEPTAASKTKRYETIMEQFDYKSPVDEKDKAIYEPPTVSSDEVLTAHGVLLLTGKAGIPNDVSPVASGDHGALYLVEEIARHCLVSQDQFDKRLKKLRDDLSVNGGTLKILGI